MGAFVSVRIRKRRRKRKNQEGRARTLEKEYASEQQGKMWRNRESARKREERG